MVRRKYSNKRKSLINRFDIPGPIETGGVDPNGIYTTFGSNGVSINPEFVNPENVLFTDTDGNGNQVNHITPFSTNQKPDATLKSGEKSSILKGIGNTIKSAASNPAIMGAVGGIANGILSNGLSTGVGNTISTIGSAVGAVNPVLGAAVSAAGGLYNGIMGSKLNKEKINEIEKGNKELLNLQVDQSSSSSIMDQFKNTTFGQSFSKGDIGKDGLASNKAKDTYKRLQAEQANAIYSALGNFSNAADNLEQNQIADTLANFTAYGGPLTMRYTGTMSPFGNRFKDGGIFIKPSKRGTFTSEATKHGKSVQEFASQVLANKENYSPAMVKKANFAKNTAKWHSMGGPLYTHGGVWSNGVVTINNGDTHENNPYEGVQFGVDNNGIPNLVEEGEVIYKDYVYSNRFKAPKNLKKALKLTGDTFADLAKSAQKESSERPNDPISQNGLQDIMNKLAIAQEEMREKKERRNNRYAEGGLLGNLYSGKGKKPNLLAKPIPNDKMPSTKDFLDATLASMYVPTFADLDKRIRERPKLTEYMVRERAPKYDKPPRFISQEEEVNPLTNLRYIPALGEFAGSVQEAFTKPDYSSADTVANYAENIGKNTSISAEKIGDYMSYNPFDIDYYSTKLAGQAGATRRALVEKSAGNRAAALDSILAADYNTQSKLGELARQGEEYNLAQRQAVGQFNRGTDQTNAELGLKAAMANQEAALKARSLGLTGITQAMAMRDAIDARKGASLSANFSNLFNSLGDIGREETMKSWINKNPALYYGISTGGAGTPYKVKNKGAKGGYLTIKRKGGIYG